MSEEIGICEECYFWEYMENEQPVLAQNNGAIRGRCHRRPPTPSPAVVPQVNRIRNTVEPTVLELTLWSITMSKAWCGAFEATAGRKRPNELLKEKQEVMVVKEEVTGKIK